MTSGTKQVFRPDVGSYQSGRRAAAFGGELGDRLRKHQLKGLILAQNERWRRGLGMQVAR